MIFYFCVIPTNLNLKCITIISVLPMEQSTLNFIYFLAVIGAIVFAVFIAKLLWVLVKMILPEKNYIERYGDNSWVVVTGGSDGIGLGFC